MKATAGGYSRNSRSLTASPAEPGELPIGLELAQLLEKASGIMDEAGGTLTEVQGKLDEALQAVTTTVNNTNGIVTDIRAGRGTAGMLLESLEQRLTRITHLRVGRR
jgi:ABC-type transporter Mla subunit MlaD